eukprot:s1134_g7.t1
MRAIHLHSPFASERVLLTHLTLMKNLVARSCQTVLADRQTARQVTLTLGLVATQSIVVHTCGAPTSTLTG